MADPPSTIPTRLHVDGEAHAVQLRGGDTLNDALRDHLGLTATKVGCEMGNCGTCTVLLDGEPVYSCLVLASECDGRAVETAAGLSDGGDDEALGPVHRAFVECDALQCGFCTPGQVVSVESLRRRAARGEQFDDAGLRRALAGNLCRCGAYVHILAAARSVVDGATVSTPEGSGDEG
jgi:aerobic-type carbon monoxide dehydrogenase small subunit (CoxS/CutS family)